MFKNVVAQFIGQMRLMNQATTEIWGWNISNLPKNERKIKIKQPPPSMGGEACPDPEPFVFVILSEAKNLTQGKLRGGEGIKVRVKSPSRRGREHCKEFCNWL